MSEHAAQHYAGISRRMIRQSHYELTRRGDRLQASEKAAGAVAHAVKAVGEDRLWRHDSHNRRRAIIDLVAAEYGQPELTVLQDIADRLHDNFYEDQLEDWQVQERLTQLTSRLEALVATRTLPPNPNFVPSPGQQRVLDRLRLTPAEIEANEAKEFPPPMPPFAPEDEEWEEDDGEAA